MIEYGTSSYVPALVPRLLRASERFFLRVFQNSAFEPICNEEDD